MKAAIIWVAAVCALQAEAAADDTDQTQLLEMRGRMGRTLKSMPNYVCLETTERLRASKADSKPNKLDTVEIEVARVGDKEMYSWPGRNMFADSQMQKVLASGLIGTGAYASQVIDILFGPATQFRPLGRETLGKRATLRWDFTVPKTDSNWTVGDAKRSAQVGQEGSVWADAETLEVVRLSVHATQFPARFPLKSVTRIVDYAGVRIGERNVLLPSAVEDRVEESRGPLSINLSRFGHCREYSASSTLTFDVPVKQPAHEHRPEVALDGPLPKATAAQVIPARATLPPGVQVVLALDDHIRSDNARIGMVVNAHLVSDVRYKGNVLATKGTPVHGLLREYVKESDGISYSFMLTIEFHELALPGGAVPFNGWLKRIDTPVKGLWWLMPSDPGYMQAVRLNGASSSEDDNPGMIRHDYEPGVAAMLVRRQESFHLFPGTRMIWITSEGAPKAAAGK